MHPLFLLQPLVSQLEVWGRDEWKGVGVFECWDAPRGSPTFWMHDPLKPTFTVTQPSKHSLFWGQFHSIHLVRRWTEIQWNPLITNAHRTANLETEFSIPKCSIRCLVLEVAWFSVDHNSSACCALEQRTDLEGCSVGPGKAASAPSGTPPQNSHVCAAPSGDSNAKR